VAVCVGVVRECVVVVVVVVVDVDVVGVVVVEWVVVVGVLVVVWVVLVWVAVVCVVLVGVVWTGVVVFGGGVRLRVVVEVAGETPGSGVAVTAEAEVVVDIVSAVVDEPGVPRVLDDCVAVEVGPVVLAAPGPDPVATPDCADVPVELSATIEPPRPVEPPKRPSAAAVPAPAANSTSTTTSAIGPWDRRRYR
jgi:hypothetical protein